MNDFWKNKNQVKVMVKVKKTKRKVKKVKKEKKGRKARKRSNKNQFLICLYTFILFKINALCLD